MRKSKNPTFEEILDRVEQPVKITPAPKPSEKTSKRIDRCRKEMNRKQRVILWSTVVVVILMGLYPPWIFVGVTSREQFEKNIQKRKQKGFNVTHTYRDQDFPLISEVVESIEYNFIFNPPRLADAFVAEWGNEYRYKLDFGLLCGQWLIVVVISSILIYTFRTKNLNVT